MRGLRDLLESIQIFFSGIPSRWLFLFLFSFLLTFLLTPLARSLAWKFKILDVPDERKIHKAAIPLLGGLAIYVSYIITLFLNFAFSRELKGVVLAGTLIFLVGLVDDIRKLPASWKLVAQIAAAAVLMGFGVKLDFLPNVWWGGAGEILLTVLWVIGLTNAVNFFDGMDGLAAGLIAISSLSFFLVGQTTSQIYLGFLAISLAGSCLGFLKYNFKPASIFLGDAGSTFIGFTIASLAVMGGWATNDPKVALSLPILVLSVFIFDMIYITVSRILTRRVKNFREWIDYTGKDHLHHRILSLGFTEVQTVLVIYLISACLGLGGINLRTSGTLRIYSEFLQAFFIFLIIVVLMIAGARRLRRENSPPS